MATELPATMALFTSAARNVSAASFNPPWKMLW